MRFFSLRQCLAAALVIMACTLSACGGGSDSVGVFSGLPTAGTPTTPPDTSVKSEMHCAP
ncbi:hypothetical protein [Variovorax sp. PAMC26660]|uniref:hypothetical protein n=1 Tax=Variovorax sp. PAMC26660 TaxID=2762322 RepID=UPI00164D6786|nr:hypothetical protein [Variovorax sp. PAMC26660]QNK65094.1 hypothetical protein H7F35_17820 [Variovorax sp. PAMC26660]